MKRIFTLLLSSLFTLSLFAGPGDGRYDRDSKLSISTATKTNELSIEVDGRRLNMQNNSITLSNIREGYHNVKIIRDKRNNGKGWGANRKQDVIYSNSILIKRGFHTDITVNRFGKVFIDERRIDRNDDWFYDDDEYYEDGGWGNQYNNVMSAREFDILKDQLRKEWFEASRVTSAKVVMDKSNFSSQQVKELLQLFTFENNKLELAKYAYRNTVDKRSYFVVNDVFNYNSSRDELARFIRDFR